MISAAYNRPRLRPDLARFLSSIVNLHPIGPLAVVCKHGRRFASVTAKSRDREERLLKINDDPVLLVAGRERRGKQREADVAKLALWGPNLDVER